MKNIWNIWLILILTIAMGFCSSAEITYSIINLTYEGNLKNENAYNITLIVETPLTDETQKILKIYSDKNWAIVEAPETKNGKEAMKIDIGSADNYLINFIVEKKFYEIKFGDNRKENENVKKFLSNSGNVRWDEEIKKKAEEVTHIANIETLYSRDVLDAIKVFKIAKFVHDNIIYDRNSKDISAKGVFRSKRAACMGYTNLFIAMCRSIGIPARAVGGIAFTDRGFERHSYAEVFIGQWVPIDPTFLQFPADASHIAIYKDNEARGIKFELKFLGGNVLHIGNINAEFIKREYENLISGKIISKNLTGKNSIMPINVELSNNKDFHVFGVCKISSKLNADDNEKIFHLLPYEKKNITFKILVPEHERGFLYSYKVGVKCKNLNLTTKFTVDGDKTGNIYNGVMIERIHAHSREIVLKNLNDENTSEVVVEICAQDRERNIDRCVNETIVIEKGADYILRHALEYPDENFILTVKCIGRDFSDIKNVSVRGISTRKNDEIFDYQKFYNFIMENLLLIIILCCLIISIVIYFKFKNRI